jgi:predicted methyltransferase MtxX (methanogen marker protein 4)
MWNKEEKKKTEEQILALRDDQIGALLNLVGLNFSKNDIENVVAEIKEHGSQSGHLPILMEEATSKENLLWWIAYFEKYNA